MQEISLELEKRNVRCRKFGPDKSLVETTTEESMFVGLFKNYDIFENGEIVVKSPLILSLGLCCDPFKDKKELFEELDMLRENNSESKEFENNEIEKILYRMFPLDYSCSYKIDGIGVSESGTQYFIVGLDSITNPNIPISIDSDGMLLNNENPSEYENKSYRKLERKKDLLREIMLKIAILNSDINDLSIFNKTSYYELLEEEKEVDRLKEEVWNLYCEEGEYTSETQSETGLPLPGSLNTKRAQDYFQTAIDKGWMSLEGNKLTWLGIGARAHDSQLAYFCGRVYDYKYSVNGNVGTEFPKNELEELFGVKNLYSSLRQVHEAKGIQKWRTCIDEIFE